MKHFSAVFAICVFCGCAARQHLTDPAFTEFFAEERTKKEFRQKYAKYEVRKEDLPAFQLCRFSKLSKTLSFPSDDGRKLELTLGERWPVATNSIYRTESRYRLLDKDRRVLASAESIFALADRSADWKLDLIVLLDAVRHTCLIAEEQSWATFRYIVIRPSHDSIAADPQHPSAWTVTYVDIPKRARPTPDGLAHLLGLHEDRVYFEEDGRYYALPIDSLERISDLAYGIG